MRYLIVLLLTLISIVGVADTKSDQILVNLNSKLKGYGSYEVKFGFVLDEDIKGSGEYVVSGESFCVRVADNVLLSDGKSSYEINNEHKEVIIDNIDTSDRSLFVNPTKTFDLIGTDFESKFIGSQSKNSTQCDVVELKPKVDTFGFISATLWISQKSGLPIAMEYNVKDMAHPIALAFNDITKIDKRVALSVITFDKRQYKDYDIVDFR